MTGNLISARVSALAVLLFGLGVAGLAVAGKPAPAQTTHVVPPSRAATVPPEVAVASPTPPPSAPPASVGGIVVLDPARHRVYGEDGIFGLPGWPWRADDATSAAPTATPSRYVFKWLGRFWPGPSQKLTR